ncbi:MAG: 50S ribosomal protein L4 [Aquabacterium sp.]|nr:50S ribosomal protein L4 [Ferruginibacter sp.]
MQVDILNIAGAKTGRTIELPEEIFGAEPNEHVVYLAVKQYLAAQRQGTHKVKTRAEANGSSKKLVKQKGTGGARKGNLRSPIYKGGGSIFGPKPHLYGFKVNRKVKDLAKISALSAKAKENAILVVEDVTMDAPKSKQFAGILKSLQLSDKKTLFVLPEDSENIYMSLRNIAGVQGTLLSDVNTYDIVNAKVIVFSESVAKVFMEEEEEQLAV